MAHDYGSPKVHKKRDGLDLGQCAPGPGQAANAFDPNKGKNVGNARGPVDDYKSNPGKHRMKY